MMIYLVRPRGENTESKNLIGNLSLSLDKKAQT